VYASVWLPWPFAERDVLIQAVRIGGALGARCSLGVRVLAGLHAWWRTVVALSALTPHSQQPFKQQHTPMHPIHRMHP